MAFDASDDEQCIFHSSSFTFQYFSALVALLRIYFDFPEINQQITVQHEFSNAATIEFVTPPCPLSPNSQPKEVSIVAMGMEKEIGRMDFAYKSCRCRFLIT